MPLLLTAAVRAGWLATFPADPIGPVDAEGFHLLAVNLLDGNGFAIGWAPPFCPTAVRTPAYPLLLAGVYTLFGRFPERAVLIQLLLEVVTAALVMALARELLRAGPGVVRAPAWMPIVAGTLYALNGLTQRFTGQLFSEALLLPVLSGAVLLTLRALRRPTMPRAMIAGIAWGMALLVKPNVQYLILGVGLLLAGRAAGDHGAGCARPRWRRHAHLRLAAAFWGAAGLMLLPWLLRNRAVMGRWIISTAFEENTARVSAVATEAALRGIVVEPWTPTWEALYDALEARAVPQLAEIGDDPTAVSCDLRRLWQQRIAAEAREVVLAHPGVYLRVHLRGVLRGLRDPGHRLAYRLLTGQDWEATGVVADIGHRMAWSLARGAVGDALAAFWSQRVARIPPLAGAIWWGATLGRVLIAVLTLRGLPSWCRRPAALLLLGLVLIYHLLLPGPIAHDRFYLPIVPVVVVAVAQGLTARRGALTSQWHRYNRWEPRVR